MKIKAIITIAIIISAALLAARIDPGNNIDQFKEGKYIHVDSMVIQFKQANATVSINYRLSPFAQSYMFLFGSKNLQPKIEEIFSEFQEVKIKKIGRSSASLQILNISKKSDEYYLHDSHKFGVQTDVLTLVYPDGKKRNVENAKETLNTFYE
ncbi:MAG: hypothetical protein ACP5N0_07005 [Methanosarcina sp.]|jgi:hypothetical protein